MDRRGAIGTLLGTTVLPGGDRLASMAGVSPDDPAALLEGFRLAFNAGDFDAFATRWAASDCRVTLWSGSADLDRGGAGSVDTVLAPLRASFGAIRAPVVPGQYLIENASGTIRYFATFTLGDRQTPLELTMRRAGAGRGRVSEIRIGDPARFAPSTVAVVDIASDGRRDVSSAVQAIYDRLVRSGGGTLQFPPGRFRLSLSLDSRNVQVRGAGRLATQLLAVSPQAVILRGAYRSGTWDVVTVSDLTLAGGEVPGGIGFQAGANSPAPDDEFAGRTRFENVRFQNLDICVDRPAGQIGLTVDDCQFEDARIHLAGSARQRAGRPLMHGGNILVRNSHFQRAREAVVRFDSAVVGTGQVTFADCIMEANPGTVFDVRNLNANDSVPAMTVSRCWNEQNATAAQVMVDGRPQPPVYARLTNCSLIRFEDTPVGSMTLRNTLVRTIDCSLDQLKSVTQDALSMIEHTRARGFAVARPAGRVDSIEATYLNEPGRGSSFWLPLRKSLSTAYRGAVAMSVTGDRKMAFVGSQTVETQPVADAALPGLTMGQRLDLAPGVEVFPSPVSLRAGRWAAWIYIYRHVAGPPPTLSLTGSAGMTLDVPLDAREWQAIGGMTVVPPGATSVSFRHRAGAGASAIHFGGINLLTFDTRQEARDFINSGLFAI